MNTIYKRSLGKVLAITAVVIGVGLGGSAFAQSSSPASASMAPYCGPQLTVITPGIHRGVRGANVTALQQFLASQGYFHGSATGYFGPITYGALVSFQVANGLPATGYFGPMTYAVFQKQCPPTPTPVGTVSIHGIEPASARVGTEVTMTGNNFTSDNTIHFGNGVIMHVPALISSTMETQCITTPCYPIQTLKFKVPASLDPACLFSTPSCLMPSQQTTPGTYNVYVTNANGTSNSVTSTVLGDSTSNAPRIDSITPSKGPVGTTVTLQGENFAPNTVVRFGEGSAVAGMRSDGKSIAFTVPDGISQYCAPGMYCAEYFRQVTPGDYKVFVQNPDGTGVSNSVTFKVGSNSTNGPHIDSISPSSAKEGASVTINGSGFSGNAVVHFYKNGEPYGTMGGVKVEITPGMLYPAQGRITFEIPGWIGAYCHLDMACIMIAQELPAGSYTIAVETTDGISNKVSFTKVSGSTGGGTISIAGIDAPTYLALGATGIWTVRVNVGSGYPNLHYSVVWGDEGYGGGKLTMAPESWATQTSASFMHAYQTTGTHTPVFTVSDDAGHSVSVSATVNVMAWY